VAGPTHKLYIDDSGNKEYAPTANYPEGGGYTRYFVFAGILITPSAAGDVAGALKKIKVNCFGTDTVELKANWLKRPTERKARYLDPFGITDAKLDALVEGTYSLLTAIEGELIAAVVDKAEIQKLYSWSPWYPPAVAYECLMQRVQKAMEGVGGAVSVTIDDMSGATPNGNQYKENLVRHHRRLKASGSRLLHGPPMSTLADIGFSDSKSDGRLQLADLVAYSCYRQFVDHGEAWDGGPGTLPAYPYFKRLIGKFRRGPGDVVAGYGIVKFPRTTWNRWAITKSKP
jgi:hypothetical protein